MSKERRYTRLPIDSLFTILAFTCKKRFWWLDPLVFTTHKWLRYLEAASLPVTMADIVRLLAKSGSPKEQSTVNWFACITKGKRQTGNSRSTGRSVAATAMLRLLTTSFSFSIYACLLCYSIRMSNPIGSHIAYNLCTKTHYLVHASLGIRNNIHNYLTSTWHFHKYATPRWLCYRGCRELRVKTSVARGNVACN